MSIHILNNIYVSDAILNELINQNLGKKLRTEMERKNLIQVYIFILLLKYFNLQELSNVF